MKPPSRAAASRSPALLAAPALLALYAVAAWSAPAGRLYHNKEYRIASFELPRGWQHAPQLGYPRILVDASGPDGARLLLAAQRVLPGTTAMEVAADARAALLRQGFVDPRIAPVEPAAGAATDDERVRLEASAPRQQQLLRQLYVVAGDVAIVVTVTAPAAHAARALRDFDAAAASLELAPPAAAPDGGTL